MTFEYLRNYCLKKPGTIEDFPFGNDVLVMKVGSKMYALIPVAVKPLTINLKCDPFLAMDLREKYRAVTPGYHMNKTHWNTVEINNTIPKKELLAMIDLSYELVFKGLKKTEKESILNINKS